MWAFYSNDLETFQTEKYGISKSSFTVKSSVASVAISYGTIPKQAGIKNTGMSKCNDPKREFPKVTKHMQNNKFRLKLFFNPGVITLKRKTFK